MCHSRHTSVIYVDHYARQVPTFGNGDNFPLNYITTQVNNNTLSFVKKIEKKSVYPSNTLADMPSYRPTFLKLCEHSHIV